MRYFLRCGSLFCYEENYRNPRQCLGCQCELFVVCVYGFCLIYGHRLPCCPLCYLLPCRVYIRPGINTLVKMLMVDLGGFAPPSRTLFSRLHTAITLITKNLCKHSSSIIEGHCFTLLHSNWYHVTHLLGYCLLLILPNALSH